MPCMVAGTTHCARATPAAQATRTNSVQRFIVCLAVWVL